MDDLVRRLFADIPALGGLRGADRLKAEMAIENAMADAIDEYLDTAELGDDPDPDPDPDPGEIVVPLRRAA
jgi:hypothetical protein